MYQEFSEPCNKGYFSQVECLVKAYGENWWKNTCYSHKKVTTKDITYSMCREKMKSSLLQWSGLHGIFLVWMWVSSLMWNISKNTVHAEQTVSMTEQKNLYICKSVYYICMKCIHRCIFECDLFILLSVYDVDKQSNCLIWHLCWTTHEILLLMELSITLEYLFWTEKHIILLLSQSVSNFNKKKYLFFNSQSSSATFCVFKDGQDPQPALFKLK